MLEDLMETAHQESKNFEEEDSSLALEELVEGQGQELMALLMEVGLEEDLEPTVEDLLELWLVEMLEGLEALETEEDLEVLETEEDLEGLELEDGQVVLAIVEGQEALGLGDEALALVEYRVALVAGTGWARVVLGSLILTLGEAKKCPALAPE